MRWGWSERRKAARRPGGDWLRPLSMSAPWLTVGLAVMMMSFLSGTFSAAKGLLFELPSADGGDTASSGAVALVMRMSGETLVFFDDARYVLNDPSSLASLVEELKRVLSSSRSRTGELLALADKSVSCEELFKFAEAAKKGGAKKVLFATRSRNAVEEGE